MILLARAKISRIVISAMFQTAVDCSYNGMCFYIFEQKKKKKSSLIKLYTKYEKVGNDIINSLICIFISTVQEMFCWKLQKLQILCLPDFLSNLHQIFTVLFEIVYSFYWINLNLDWISPLNLSCDFKFMFTLLNLIFCPVLVTFFENGYDISIASFHSSGIFLHWEYM